MHTFILGLLIFFSIQAVLACQGDSSDPGNESLASAHSASRVIPQVMPPLDIKTLPNDAMKTSSGFAYRVLTATNNGARVQRGDTVLVQYTGWRQRTDETFFTTKGIGQALTLDVDHAAPAFRELLQSLRKGEKAVLWIPPNETASETLVYEVEVMDVLPPSGVAAKRGPAADVRQDSLTR